MMADRKTTENLKPGKLKSDKMRLELLTAMNEIGDGIKKDFERTTKTWKHKVKFGELGEAAVFTCARCGRHFSHPIPLDHVCATIIETTARDVPPNTLLLPEENA